MFGRTDKRARPADRIERIEPFIGNMVELQDVPSSDAVRMGQIFNAPPSAAGASVTTTTSMRVATVFRCVQILAGAIATMPLHVYERNGGARKRVDHDVWWLLNEKPFDGWVAAAFWEWVVANMLLRGDAFAYIKRRGPAIFELVPLQRGQVMPSRQEGVLVYDVQDPDGVCNGRKTFRCGGEDMLHFAGFGFDGVSSLSVISWAARMAIGIAIRTDEFAGQFYGEGASFQYALKAEGQIGTDAAKELRENWTAKYGGRGLNSEPLLLPKGLSVQELSLTPIDAQLLESRKWQVSEICRAFGVPPHMVGEAAGTSAWGSGIEQLGIGFVRYSLQPHMTRIGQETNAKIWPVRARYFVEHDPRAFLGGDLKAQADYTSKALGGPGAQGWMTINEARREQYLPPIPGGDQIVMAGTKPTPKPKPEDTEDNTDDSQDPAAVPG